jgi:L-threonylcarbamoyladenylate synthase
MLRKTLGRVDVDKGILEKLEDGQVPLAPGMLYRHYAPRASLIGLSGGEGKVLSYMREKLMSEKSAVLCFDEDLAFLPKSENILTLGSKLDKRAHAKLLFDRLREFDKMQVEKIYTRIPDSTELGLAVVNRLLKACGYTVVDTEQI